MRDKFLASFRQLSRRRLQLGLQLFDLATIWVDHRFRVSTCLQFVGPCLKSFLLLLQVLLPGCCLVCTFRLPGRPCLLELSGLLLEFGGLLLETLVPGLKLLVARVE